MKKPLIIEPISFRPGRHPKGSKSFARYRWLIGLSIGLIFVLLMASVWFVFTAKQVVIRIEPKPDRIQIKPGFFAPKLATHYLLRPGEYRLWATKHCYQSLEQRFQVSNEKNQEIDLFMDKLPGKFSLKLHRSDQTSVSLDGARVFIDGREVGTAPITEMEVKSGKRQLQVRAENYQELQTGVIIEGCGHLQSFEFALVPAWSEVLINSVPQSAGVSIDGTLAGKTPLRIDLAAGTHQVEITAEGYKTWKTQLAVQPNQPQELDGIRLEPANGVLVLKSNPPGANVTLGKVYVGQTPAKLKVAADIQHEILISKPGYETVSRKLTVSSSEARETTVDLNPKKGLIHFMVEPADAELVVDGKSRGQVPSKLRLLAVEHQLEIKKEGYDSHRTQITPRPGFPQEIKIALSRSQSKELVPAPVIKTKTGYPLNLIRGQTFTMGSSRRQQGRRSNETLRTVKLVRPFYLGVREVTNREFREFSANHSSGAFKGHSLNRDEQPVVQVTWQQAAMFCNWLSAKESLPPAYVKKGDTLVAAEPLGPGYRLPTEAEWEYCARFDNNRATLKYPWGDKFPPPSKSGNYADISAKGLLSFYLEDYDDGYPLTASPAQFRANGVHLYDLGGNVAEWCHDFYSIYSYNN
jgi:formylglycine-generating enzyme required for sulfatase activity